MTRSQPGGFRLGIDAGGTFTDVVWRDGPRLGTAKVPSRPDSPAEAVLAGLSRAPGGAGPVCHGTTVGTNAVLARHGGPARMVVTRGFRDVLEIGRGARDDLYSISPGRPRPLLNRTETYEIDLRLNESGVALSSPTNESILDLAEDLRNSGARAVALGTLHSAAHPGAEKELAEQLENLTGLPVFASAQLAAYPREYERWSLAALAAYLAPVLGKYLSELAERCPGQLGLMASSGGLVSPKQTRRNPAICVLSGPAGGAQAAMSLDRDRVLALDMGGTSTDVTLLAGKLPRTREAEIDRLPLPLPTIDIHTIGAGGGSTVKVDPGGMLTLGPESAGASPGPACYGNGGPAALSDVALLAGRLVPSYFLGGEMSIDARAARNALEEVRPSTMSLDELVDGILDLAIVHLTGALRRISIARGIDPSTPGAEFALVPFGGAGALFGVECARSLGLKEVVHPRAAGVFSAIGLMHAPFVAETERAVLARPAESANAISDMRLMMQQELAESLAEWPESDEITFATTLECRYFGQTHTLEIPLPEDFTPGMIVDSFQDAYRTRYTYTHKYDEVEIVTVRVRGEIPQPEIEWPDVESRHNPDDAVIGTTRLRLESKRIEAPVLARDRIPADQAVKGPALVVQDFATLYLPPDTVMHMDRKGHAIIEIG